MVYTYEHKNVDRNVRNPFVVWSGEMKFYCIMLFVVSDVKEVAAKSVLCYCVLSLSNILFTTGFVSDAVNEVGTFAANVVFARVFFVGGCAFEFVLTLQEWAKLAFLC